MGTPIDLHNAISWYLQQRQHVMNIWQLFAAACVGVMGFATISDEAATCLLGLLFAAGFLVLAAGNFVALQGMYVELHASYALARQVADEHQVKLPFTPPISRRWAIAFQIVLSIGTFIAILIKIPCSWLPRFTG
jgi:hypothetical protein